MEAKMRRGWGMCRELAVAALLVAAAVPGRAADRTVQEKLGHPKDARLLVIHADDLGMSHSVNRATFEALEQGWITSASILVPCPWFPEVVRWARAHPEADLGIHLALTSEWTSFRWRPLTAVEQVPSLMDADGYLPLVEMTVARNAVPAEAERELRAQVERAKAAGIRITHFDSHMNALFQTGPLLDVYTRLARDYQVPLRWDRTMAAPPGGTMPAEAVLLDRIVAVNPGVDPKAWRAEYQKLLEPLPPGVYEMVVHLAYADEEMWGATGDHPDWGAAWRRYDLDLVKSPEFRQFLKDKGFVLVTWKELARAGTME
jgi:predicted glycoside hydrolase/deacetylase ChbG (UPF0249 family)